MTVLDTIKSNIQTNIADIFKIGLELKQIELNFPPNKDLGDYALACFDIAKLSKQSPNEVAKTLADKYKLDDLIVSAKAAGPYLNITIDNNLFAQLSLADLNDKNFGQNIFGQDKKIMIEFSGPNTNKPQHLGHVRNDVLGQTLVNLHRACGFSVIPVNIINDRGIHIVKSMLSYQKWGNNETPESTKTKGDHFVGIYYVRFNQELKKEKEQYYIENTINLDKLSDLDKRKTEEEFLAQSPLMQEAQIILKQWEDNNKEVRQLWQTMNDWVYQGFEETYTNLGITFDKVYYESDTYLLGKDMVEAGLKQNVFYKKEDNSVWADLSAENLDDKLVLRGDGTSVYITQDLGTAKDRYDEFELDNMIYVVANEQNYHFKILFLILKKLGYNWADNLHHLAYGMVNLPDGKMKSREGNVVDADDMIKEMKTKATDIMAKAQKQIKTTAKQDQQTAEMVGLGALKFFMLSTNPQKDMTFDPQASISFDGYTGPFIQYTHARINNILKKAANIPVLEDLDKKLKLNDEEKILLKLLLNFPETITQATISYNPATLTQYLFELAKIFNHFYQQHSVLQADDENTKHLRLQLCLQTKKILAKGLKLLGIEAPEVM
ncbi:arginine--tRNA ligase [bacterium]|jgi:arginyl-tRNA synthetase|nr:arginine--tRNA ligase [bacterium]MBT4649130.1 arginine--tRNA ligase [bacterium]